MNLLYVLVNFIFREVPCTILAFTFLSFMNWGNSISFSFFKPHLHLYSFSIECISASSTTTSSLFGFSVLSIVVVVLYILSPQFMPFLLLAVCCYNTTALYFRYLGITCRITDSRIRFLHTIYSSSTSIVNLKTMIANAETGNNGCPILYT